MMNRRADNSRESWRMEPPNGVSTGVTIGGIEALLGGAKLRKSKVTIQYKRLKRPLYNDRKRGTEECHRIFGRCKQTQERKENGSKITQKKTLTKRMGK